MLSTGVFFSEWYPMSGLTDTHRWVSLLNVKAVFMSRFRCMARLGTRRIGLSMCTRRWSNLSPFFSKQRDNHLIMIKNSTLTYFDEYWKSADLHLIYYVLVSVSPWKRTWYRQRDKVDFITLLLITFHWLIETMLDHVTVVFSYATAVVLNFKTQSVNIYSGFKC